MAQKQSAGNDSKLLRAAGGDVSKLDKARKAAGKYMGLHCKGDLCFDDAGNPVLKLVPKSKKEIHGCSREMFDKLTKKFLEGKNLRVDFPTEIGQDTDEEEDES